MRQVGSICNNLRQFDSTFFRPLPSGFLSRWHFVPAQLRWPTVLETRGGSGENLRKSSSTMGETLFHRLGWGKRFFLDQKSPLCLRVAPRVSESWQNLDASCSANRQVSALHKQRMACGGLGAIGLGTGNLEQPLIWLFH